MLDLLGDAPDDLVSAVIQRARALTIESDSAHGRYNLGNALRTIGLPWAAAREFRKAIALAPAFSTAIGNLANIGREQLPLHPDATVPPEPEIVPPSAPEVGERLKHWLAVPRAAVSESAILGAYHRALSLDPMDSEIWGNLGLAYLTRARGTEAERAFRTALSVSPGSARAHFDLGCVLDDRLPPDAAILAYSRSLDVKADHVLARWNRSLLDLLNGDCERGWPGYEWRWRKPDSPHRSLDAPLWAGEPLAGRTLLLHTEQGFGDTLMVVRFVHRLIAEGHRVAIQCQPALVRLLSRIPGVDAVVSSSDPLPRFDLHLPMMSLPGALGIGLEELPGPCPYVSVEAAAVDRWRRRFAARPGPRVGLCWKGNPRFVGDRLRSPGFDAIRPISAFLGKRAVCLVRELQDEPLSDYGIEDVHSELGDFAETAAMMSALDLVVTSDTAVANLAGALGLDAWVMLPYIPDWRWLRDRTDSPWYPSARLFRQSHPGSWPEVANAIRTSLAERFSA